MKWGLHSGHFTKGKEHFKVSGALRAGGGDNYANGNERNEKAEDLRREQEELPTCSLSAWQISWFPQSLVVVTTKN
jgi:hypothetical protein